LQSKENSSLEKRSTFSLAALAYRKGAKTKQKKDAKKFYKRFIGKKQIK